MSYLANKSESGIYTVHNWKKWGIFWPLLIKNICRKRIQIDKYLCVYN